MAHELKVAAIGESGAGMEMESRSVAVSSQGDIQRAAVAARAMAVSLGFAANECEEIALAATELASNLVKHAAGGVIRLAPAGVLPGIRIESEDRGPGILDVEKALADGYTTAGSLGAGLGAVNRLMDELEFYSLSPNGIRIVCQRWRRPDASIPCARWLEFGVATRAYRRLPENGDAFVIRQWEGFALVGIIDGLGHGQFAQRASQTARHYIEQHFDQSLDNLFRGAGRACRATRGVVMTLARFDMAARKVLIAGIGNVEARLIANGDPARANFVSRRGIVGLNAPNPLVVEIPWKTGNFLILHSDGLKTHWNWTDFPGLAHEKPGVIAQRLLYALGKIDDDATVLVAGNAPP
ncbi:MAG TPA: ATP-binding protein [Chthoniobacteraceae bacterium]|nr:ATP-binding protein [Chthoniobacteraceae bacterium]